jgi:hypothetical protein
MPRSVVEVPLAVTTVESCLRVAAQQLASNLERNVFDLTRW